MAENGWDKRGLERIQARAGSEGRDRGRKGLTLMDSLLFISRKG